MENHSRADLLWIPNKTSADTGTVWKLPFPDGYSHKSALSWFSIVGWAATWHLRNCTCENVLEDSILQHNAITTHCDTLQHIATHYDTLQHNATQIALAVRHTTTHCNTLRHTATQVAPALRHTATHCDTLQHTATHCDTHCTGQSVLADKQTATHWNLLRHTATYCNTLQHKLHRRECPRETHCNTLQHTATHCSTLQHKLYRRECPPGQTHCNTLQHTATQIAPARMSSRNTEPDATVRESVSTACRIPQKSIHNPSDHTQFI